MKRNKTQVSEQDLHRYVDGELSDSRAKLVAERIAEDESLAKQVAAYREINRKLAEVYASAQTGPVPARLLLAISNRRGFSAWRIAATFAWLLLGGVIGYTLQGQVQQQDYIRPLPVEAAFAHTVYVPEIRHPVEVNASEQDHLNAWLSKRLNRPIAAPDLRAAGYALIGGRLLPDGHRPAAQFMYEDSAGKRVTLYLRHALKTRETAFLHAENDGLGVVYWIDNGLAYALTASADKALLTRTAEIVYREANP